MAKLIPTTINNLSDLISALDKDPTLNTVVGGFIGAPARGPSINPVARSLTKANKEPVNIISIPRSVAFSRTVVEPEIATTPEATETLAGTTSEVFAEDLNARLTQAEADIDANEANILQLDELKASLASPALTGTPTAPTATQGTNTTQIATTQFVTGAISDLIDDAPGVLDTLQEIAASLGDDPDFAGTLTATLALKAPLDSPGFTGTASFTGRITTNSITIDNNKISTNDTNTNLELDPNGTGNVTIQSNLLVTSNTYTDTIIPYSTDGITISGDTIFTSGIVDFQSVRQAVVSISGATGVVEHNLNTASVFFHSSISSNFTANFTNVPTDNDKGLGIALILEQGGTGYLPTAVQINGASATLRWAYNTVPTPSSSQIDTVSFTLLRIDGTWIVVAQHTNFA